jgi:hypothetical protein
MPPKETQWNPPKLAKMDDYLKANLISEYETISEAWNTTINRIAKESKIANSEAVSFPLCPNKKQFMNEMYWKESIVEAMVWK